MFKSSRFNGTLVYNIYYDKFYFTFLCKLKTP